MIPRSLGHAAKLILPLLLLIGGALAQRASALEVLVNGQLMEVIGTFTNSAGQTMYQVVLANLPEGAALTEGSAMTVAASEITIVEGPLALTGTTAAAGGAGAATSAGTGVAVTIVGYAVVASGAVVAIVKAGQYYYYTGLLVDPGSQPANNLTDYENPANWWQNTVNYWSSFFSGAAG